jgi:IS30 family transposase
MNIYHHLNQPQRYQIEALLKAGLSQTAIATQLAVHRSTISREIRRNSTQAAHPPDKYKASNAQLFAQGRAYKPWSQKTKDPRIIRRIIWLLRHDWSPQQIASVCKQRGLQMLSTEGIYLWIYKHRFKYDIDLTNHLRRRHRKRRKRALIKQPRVIIKNKTSIHQRPPSVAMNTEIGHFEIDTAKCTNGYLLVLTERKTNYNFIYKMPDKSSQSVLKAMENLHQKIAIKTITSDNGTEFAQHQQIAKMLNTNWYFADPQSPHQRGCNENQIGLIRQYLTRKTDLNNYSNDEIITIQTRINARPRKKLNYFSPFKLFLYPVALRA